jgi:hypothetical protein
MNRRAFVEGLEKRADALYVAAKGLHRFSVGRALAFTSCNSIFIAIAARPKRNQHPMQ